MKFQSYKNLKYKNLLYPVGPLEILVVRCLQLFNIAFRCDVDWVRLPVAEPAINALCQKEGGSGTLGI